MDNNKEIKQLKELVAQQGALITSLSVIMFRVVFNSDSIVFNSVIQGDTMSNLLRETTSLSQKMNEVFKDDGDE